MTKKEADKLIKEAKAFIGRKKPVVKDGLLGFPSIIEECRFDETFLIEENGNFIPMAKMISNKTGLIVTNDNLKETLEYFRRNTG